MKNLFIIGLALVGSLQASAYVGGSACGLTDQTSDAWEETQVTSLTRMTDAQINRLPTLMKQQLIITAKNFAKGGAGDDTELNNTVDAVYYLRLHSDASTLSVIDFSYEGNDFTQVLHYPGDNPVGVIFEQGTRHVVAYNGDDSIECK